MNKASCVEFKTRKASGYFVHLPVDNDQVRLHKCRFKNIKNSDYSVFKYSIKTGMFPSHFHTLIPKGNYKIVGFSDLLITRDISTTFGMTYKEYSEFLVSKGVIPDRIVSGCYVVLINK